MAGKTKVALYLSDTMLERIDGYCDIEGMTRNAYIQMAIKTYIDQQRTMDLTDLAKVVTSFNNNIEQASNHEQITFSGHLGGDS